MKIVPEAPVSMDFENENYSKNVTLFRPDVYREADLYCCIPGTDPETGVFGSGTSKEAALAEWERNLKELVRK